MSHTFARDYQRTLRVGVASFSALALLTLPAVGQADFLRANAAQAPIISLDRERDGEAMNYAVVLAEGTSAEQLTALSEYVDAQGNKSLVVYPHLHLFFAQSAKKDFASQVATYAAEQNITLHSVGPTRTNIITDSELVVDTAAAPAAGGGAGGRQSKFADGEWQPDPYTVKNNWALYAIGAIDAQQVDVPRAEVVVGVIDTGVDGDHPDLAGQIVEEKSVSCGHNGIANTARDQWQDVDKHGTHVAGTIAAGHNGVGVDSVAPQVKIAAVRASDEEGYFYPEYVTCAFDWAATQGFDVTNNSYYVDPWEFWVPTEPSQAAGYEAVRRAAAHAHNSGVLNVVAAGNSNYDLANPTTDDNSPNDVEGTAIKGRDVTGGFDLPAMLPQMIRVSAVGQADRGDDPATGVLDRANFSNYGDGVITVAAPGVRIASTTPKGKYEYLNGTSMASPHVAGVAGLLKSIHPDATPDRLTELLTKHAAENYGRLSVAEGKEYRGVGLVNALAAVLKDQPRPEVGAVEYSVNGTDWMPVDGALNVRQHPSVHLRVAASGPATVVSVQVGDGEPVSVTSDDPFGTDLTVTTGAVNVKELFGDASAPVSVPVKISAQGRNKDARADDDVTVNATVELVDQPFAPHPEELGVTVSAESVEAGQTVTFSAAGFVQGENVTFTVHSTPVVAGTVAADADGRARLEWVVPANFEVGEHSVVAAGANDRQAQAAFTVTASTAPTVPVVSVPDTHTMSGNSDAASHSGAQSVAVAAPTPLAVTGAHTGVLMAVAGLVLVAGGVGAAAKRRTR